jgi:hypothetical protein
MNVKIAKSSGRWPRTNLMQGEVEKENMNSCRVLFLNKKRICFKKFFLA